MTRLVARWLWPPAVLLQIDTDLASPLLEHGPELLLHGTLHLVGEHDSVLDVQVAELRFVVHAVAVLVVSGHALASDGVDVARLHDLAPLASQLHDVPIQVGDVPRPVAHPRLAHREHLVPEQVVAAPPEEHAVYVVRVILRQPRGLLYQYHVDVTRDVIRVGVGLILVDDAELLGGAARHLEVHGRGLAHDALARARLALVLDDLAALAAGITGCLQLLEHAGGQLALDDPDAMAAAVRALLDDAVGGARAVARLADVLALPRELGVGAVVEVAQAQTDAELRARPALLLGVEVAAAAEELREEVEGVVRAVRGAARVAVALDALVAVAVVDAAEIRVDKGLVGGRDLDELVLGRWVVGVLVRVVLLGKAAVCGLYGAVICLAVDAEDLERGKLVLEAREPEECRILLLLFRLTL